VALPYRRGPWMSTTGEAIDASPSRGAAGRGQGTAFGIG
jgi:hypothetical protein